MDTQMQTSLQRNSSGKYSMSSDDFSLGGFDGMKGTQAHAKGGFLKNLLGTGSSAHTDTGRKLTQQKASDGSAPKKLFMDMLGPLLGGNASKQPAKELEADKMARCISQNSGLTEYVNKMKISETGKRSKLSNDSAVSSTSQMSIGSAMSTQSMQNSQMPATPAGAPQASFAPLSPPPQQAPSATVGVSSNLDRLLEAARFCQLPQNGRPVQPMPADPYANPHQGPTVLLTVAASITPRMQRSHWCLDDYVLGDKLYTGYASTVYKATCKRSAEVVVLKIYHLLSVCDLYKYQIYREVKVHCTLQHENIVHLVAAFQEGDKVIMVQEYADGADLFTLLHKYGGRLSERLAVQMVLDPFLRVLQFLHSRAIIHRDIKPENILFNKAMALKLADFGLAIDLREERAVTRAGTLDYMAPEVLKCPFKSRPEENKEKDSLHYSARVDAWAVGVLTYELLVGFPPFFDQSRTNTEERINKSLPQFPANLSEEAKHFITKALSKSPLERPTILEMLHHPWIEQYRTRRSMRQIGQPAVSPTGPAAAAGARRPAAGTPLQSVHSSIHLTSALSPAMNNGHSAHNGHNAAGHSPSGMFVSTMAAPMPFFTPTVPTGQAKPTLAAPALAAMASNDYGMGRPATPPLQQQKPLGLASAFAQAPLGAFPPLSMQMPMQAQMQPLPAFPQNLNQILQAVNSLDRPGSLINRHELPLPHQHSGGLNNALAPSSPAPQQQHMLTMQASSSSPQPMQGVQGMHSVNASGDYAMHFANASSGSNASMSRFSANSMSSNSSNC